MISFIIVFSLNPLHVLHKPQCGKPYVMFNALYVVNNNKCKIFSFSLYFYINTVQDYPILINVINELGQK